MCASGVRGAYYNNPRVAAFRERERRQIDEFEWDSMGWPVWVSFKWLFTPHISHCNCPRIFSAELFLFRLLLQVG